MTQEERKAMLLRAQGIRQEHSEWRQKIQAGLDPLTVILQRNNQTVQRMRLEYVLRSVPGIGKHKAEKIMMKLGVDTKIRLTDLVTEQVIRLADILAGRAAQPVATPRRSEPETAGTGTADSTGTDEPTQRRQAQG